MHLKADSLTLAWTEPCPTELPRFAAPVPAAPVFFMWQSVLCSVQEPTSLRLSEVLRRYRYHSIQQAESTNVSCSVSQNESHKWAAPSGWPRSVVFRSFDRSRGVHVERLI